MNFTLFKSSRIPDKCSRIPELAPRPETFDQEKLFDLGLQPNLRAPPKEKTLPDLP